jgi:uncharacterized DUF497 family protein
MIIKLSATLKKHRCVSFEEASTCLLDPMALVVEDPDAESEQCLHPHRYEQ